MIQSYDSRGATTLPGKSPVRLESVHWRPDVGIKLSTAYVNVNRTFRIGILRILGPLSHSLKRSKHQDPTHFRRKWIFWLNRTTCDTRSWLETAQHNNSTWRNTMLVYDIRRTTARKLGLPSRGTQRPEGVTSQTCTICKWIILG